MLALFGEPLAIKYDSQCPVAVYTTFLTPIFAGPIWYLQGQSGGLMLLSGHCQISHMASFLTFSSTIHTRYIDYRLYYLYTIHYILWAGILSLVYIIYHTVIYYILCTINWSIVLSHTYICTLYMYACTIIGPWSLLTPMADMIA